MLHWDLHSGTLPTAKLLSQSFTLHFYSAHGPCSCCLHCLRLECKLSSLLQCHLMWTKNKMNIPSCYSKILSGTLSGWKCGNIQITFEQFSLDFTHACENQRGVSDIPLSLINSHSSAIFVHDFILWSILSVMTCFWSNSLHLLNTFCQFEWSTKLYSKI